MGNPNYTIDDTLTASAGQNFLAILTTAQADQVIGIVDLQKSALTELVPLLKNANFNFKSIMKLNRMYSNLAACALMLCTRQPSP